MCENISNKNVKFIFSMSHGESLLDHVKCFCDKVELKNSVLKMFKYRGQNMCLLNLITGVQHKEL